MCISARFLSSSFAHYAAGMIAGAMAIGDSDTGSVDPLTSLLVYTTVFEKLALVAIVLAVVVLAMSPMLHKRMHGVR